MEASTNWTVCLPGKKMETILDICGTKSGRDIDKFKELKLTAKKGIKIDAPYIEECPVHYECETVFKTDMKPGQLVKEIESEFYKTMDLHMIYFGEVKGCYAVPDAENKFP